MAKQTFPISGTLVVDADTGTFTLDGTFAGTQPLPPNPPTPSGDQIDLSQAIITSGSPDVRGWPITATFTSLGLSALVDATIDFTKRWGPGAWPFITGPEGGDLQYTLWVGCFIQGQWYVSAVIPCISRGQSDNYVPTGPTLQPGQLPNNWYYFAGSPLASYQPHLGETVAWFLTSGDQRRGDISVIQERTQVVLAPFAEGVYTWA